MKSTAIAPLLLSSLLLGGGYGGVQPAYAEVEDGDSSVSGADSADLRGEGGDSEVGEGASDISGGGNTEAENGDSQVSGAELSPFGAEIRYGVGLRLRTIYVPKFLIELGAEEVASGVNSFGIGADFVRRVADTEISMGLEYESLSPDDGYYVERGRTALSPGATDYLEFERFAWLTLDAAIFFHRELRDRLSLRYGGGIGLGLILGTIYETEAFCRGPEAQSDCSPVGARSAADTPPVFPVVNLAGGLQYRATERVLVHFDVGLRTVPYAGLGAQYFF